MALPIRLLRLANPVVCAVLDSPAHGLLSGSLAQLEVADRADGRRRIPVLVAPAEDADELIVLAVAPERKRWWRRFRAPADAVLVVRRERRPVAGQLLEEPDARRRALRAYLRRYPRAAGTLGVVREPTDADLDVVDAAVVLFRGAG